jgi:hypothetical protein
MKKKQKQVVTIPTKPKLKAEKPKSNKGNFCKNRHKGILRNDKYIISNSFKLFGGS